MYKPEEWKQLGTFEDGLFYIELHIPCGREVDIPAGHEIICPTCQPNEYARYKQEWAAARKIPQSNDES